MSNRKIFVIGISGQTGAGKSTTADMLSELGFGVNYEIDKLGHEVLKKEQIIKLLVENFSDEILDDSGSVDRRILGQKVFSKEENTMLLNSIMHPAMIEIIKERIDKDDKSGVKSIIINAALLFTMELDSLCDAIIYVETNAQIRLERLVSTRGLSRTTAEKRLFSQDKMPSDKTNLLIIKNNKDEDFLKKETQRIAKELKKLIL